MARRITKPGKYTFDVELETDCTRCAFMRRPNHTDRRCPTHTYTNLEWSYENEDYTKAPKLRYMKS